jgi:hypothetical protein
MAKDLSFVQQNAVLHKSCTNKMSFKVLPLQMLHYYALHLMVPNFSSQLASSLETPASMYGLKQFCILDLMEVIS